MSPFVRAADLKTDGQRNALEPQSSITILAEAPSDSTPWWYSIKEPGSTLQIILSALFSLAIGLTVVTTVDHVPQAAINLLGIPGSLWLRALQAVVIPLIMTSLIISVQRLKSSEDGNGNKLARWTVGFYVATTVFAVVVSTLLASLVFARQFPVLDGEALALDPSQQNDIDSRESYSWSETIVNLFESFIPRNILSAMANSELLSIVVVSVILGALVKAETSLMKAVYEIEALVTTSVAFLIKSAPVGIFFLIISNLLRLDLAQMGTSLAWLICGALTGLFAHLLVTLPLIFLLLARANPYAYWIKCAPAWITAWGCDSSAATLPVTMRCVQKQGVPEVVTRFTVPLGCIINMDGTAIYFPIVVTCLAETQGISLTPADYAIVVLLSTLSAIGATAIPSSSLVLTLMICQSINVPITGMYAVVVAVDWFLDRFRTATNVSGDLYAAKIIARMAKIVDDESV